MKQHLDPELQRLLRLPWTIVSEISPEGDRLLRVKEIPSAVGCGETEADAIADLWEALTESLRAHLHFGDPIPVPARVPAQWSQVGSKERRPQWIFLPVEQSARTGGNSGFVKI